MKYKIYSPEEKQKILQEYQPKVRGKGFKALATRFKIKGGHKAIRFWYKRWNGSVDSLRKLSGGDRRSIFTDKEKKVHIKKFIDKAAQSDPVTYPEVKNNVELKTGKVASLTTVKKIGKQLNESSKKTKEVLESQGIANYFDIAYQF